MIIPGIHMLYLHFAHLQHLVVLNCTCCHVLFIQKNSGNAIDHKMLLPSHTPSITECFGNPNPFLITCEAIRHQNSGGNGIYLHQCHQF